jgi:hypothetical protein
LGTYETKKEKQNWEILKTGKPQGEEQGEE